MNKTLECWLRGYVVFDVNGHRFYRYNEADSFCDHLVNRTQIPLIQFKGYHIFKGWQTFYIRWNTDITSIPSMTMSARL